MFQEILLKSKIFYEIKKFINSDKFKKKTNFSYKQNQKFYKNKNKKDKSFKPVSIFFYIWFECWISQFINVDKK